MKTKVGYITDKRCLLHKPDFSHAEHPGRLEAINKRISDERLLQTITAYESEEANLEKILAVHSSDHVNNVIDSIKNKSRMLDSDTYINEHSLNAALLSAGGAIKAVDLVMSKVHSRVFCALRPPGHHATRNEAMGFCLFNNIAIAAQHAIDHYELSRIAIVDWDVHHGNGTQDIFYETDKVFFISVHQHPLYPGTGLENETGIGAGKGYTTNFPVAPGTGEEMYLEIFRNRIIKILEQYDPHLLMISAGFDAHQADPLADVRLSTESFGKLTGILTTFADIKNIPVVSLLEGGYNLDALSESVSLHLKKLSE